MNMINYKKLAEHGALIDNADFIMLKCNFCGKLALYDEERALLNGDGMLFVSRAPRENSRSGAN